MTFEELDRLGVTASIVEDDWCLKVYDISREQLIEIFTMAFEAARAREADNYQI